MIFWPTSGASDPLLTGFGGIAQRFAFKDTMFLFWHTTSTVELELVKRHLDRQLYAARVH